MFLHAHSFPSNLTIVISRDQSQPSSEQRMWGHYCDQIIGLVCGCDDGDLQTHVESNREQDSLTTFICYCSVGLVSTKILLFFCAGRLHHILIEALIKNITTILYSSPCSHTFLCGTVPKNITTSTAV